MADAVFELGQLQRDLPGLKGTLTKERTWTKAGREPMWPHTGKWHKEAQCGQGRP